MATDTGIIPRGYDHLHPNVCKNLFFSTTTEDAYRSPEKQTKAKKLMEGARAKSMQSIQDPNKGAQKYQVSQAPLYQRSMCQYSQDFVPLPLGGLAVTKEFYRLFKDKSQTIANKAGQGPLQKDTTNSRSYPSISAETAAKCKLQCFVPTPNLYITDNKLMVTESDTHRSFVPPSADMAKEARGESCKPRVGGQKVTPIPFVSNTSYSNAFDAAKYGWKDKAVFSAFATDGRTKAPPVHGYTGKTKARETEEKILDPEEFCRGNQLQYEYL